MQERQKRRVSAANHLTGAHQDRLGSHSSVAEENRICTMEATGNVWNIPSGLPPLRGRCWGKRKGAHLTGR